MTLRLSYAGDDIDTDAVSDFILSSHWARNLSRNQILASFAHSACTSLLDGQAQIGFARAVSDNATCAHIKDFFILPEHQKQGHGTRLLRGLLAHPDLRDVPSWYIGTKTAQGFYAKSGFQPAPDGINMYRHLD